MHLSNYTDYAYRILIYVSVNRKRCTLNEISTQFNVSLEHLRKVVHALGKSGYIATFKGKNGGFELNRPANEINVGDVFKDFELAKNHIIDCDKKMCILNHGCKLKKVLFDSQQAFITELSKYTIQDLIESNSVNILVLNSPE
jgi:Rrf2 family nitric oxide-sensitive transcriptional repressor